MDNNRLKENRMQKMDLLFLLIMIVGVMFLMAANGVISRLTHAAAQYAKESAGYLEKVYMADTKSDAPQAMPVMGTGYLEQPIYLSQEMCGSGQVMLGLKMATYDRKNTGELYAACIQESEEKIFVMDMEKIRDNSEVKLLFSTENFQEGYLNVKLYAPQSSGENCVALYVVENTNTYLPLYVNGEQTEKNAVIAVYLPSKYANSDFEAAVQTS